MKHIEQVLNLLINDEVIKASNKHPDFQSSHHGYAVILEEMEEMEICFGRLEKGLTALWKTTKEDRFDHQEGIINGMEGNLLQLIQEAIQIGAMLERYKTFLDNKK